MAQSKMSMKVAMIGHKRIPSRESGVEIVVEELSTRFVNKNFKVTAYNRAKKGYQRIKEHKEIEIFNVPTINKKNLDAPVYAIIATFHAILKTFDVIHYHAEGSCFMLWLPKLFKVPTVVTIHGLDWQRAKWNKLASGFIKLGEKVAVRYADKIIVLSANLKEYFMSEYGRETTYIPNGVNLPDLAGDVIIKAKWGLEKNGYILFLSRIVPEKGLHYLIEAFNSIETNKKLVIAGDSSHTDAYLESMKKKAAVDDRIIFTGFVENEEYNSLFSNAYVYILPSDLEGMPISLLEAMSFNNCCLVSNIPENLEVIGNAGVTFEAGNITSLREAIQKLIEDVNTVNRCKQVSAKYILDKYNWDKTADLTLEVYQRAVHK